MEISYFEMSPGDIPAVAAMEAKYFGIPWKEESIAHYMEAGNTIFLTARRAKKIVGYMALMCVADESDLVSICVHEDYRNLGIARELLDISYEMASKRGVRTVNLEVRESNAAAISLYESENFTRVGKRPGFYKKPEEDALLYRKELEDA